MNLSRRAANPGEHMIEDQAGVPGTVCADRYGQRHGQAADFCRLGARARLESAVGEGCAVAVADGAAVDRGKILATLASLPATMPSSMQKDVSAGRVPELDAIGGLILRRGERYNLNVPVTREMVARIQGRLSTLHSASAS